MNQPEGVEVCEDVETLWLKLLLCKLCFFVAVCYHPSSPVYSPTAFISSFSESIDCIISSQTDFVVIVDGDFNFVNTDFIASNCGLCHQVKIPTPAW
jgi:hypothetical protein